MSFFEGIELLIWALATGSQNTHELKSTKKLLVVVGLSGRLPPHVLPDIPQEKKHNGCELALPLGHEKQN